MSKDFKEVLIILYDKFGDDLINLGATALKNKLQEKNDQMANSATGEKVSDSQESELLDSSKNSELPQEDSCFPETECSEDDQSSAAHDEVNYYDADTFEKAILDETQNRVTVVMDSKDVVGAVTDLVLLAGEVRKFEEAQITVRTDIAAQRDIALANIEVQKAAIMTYLDKSFDERRENFQALFSVVDDALEKNNMQQLAMSLESIIKLAESSPFKDLATVEATATALNNPDHEWDF